MRLSANFQPIETQFKMQSRNFVNPINTQIRLEGIKYCFALDKKISFLLENRIRRGLMGASPLDRLSFEISNPTQAIEDSTVALLYKR